MKKIIIGSRGSKLALWQAYFTQDKLKEIGVDSEIKIIKTQGDKIQHLSFDKLEGKGFFTKEIEAELLAGTIDLAVHSHKDLETEEPKGLVVSAVSYRENPSDILVIRKEAVDNKKTFALKENAIVGTSSARRKSQLLFFCPTVELKDLRGNVPTRIEKLKSGNYDAIMLAKAGVERLEINLSEFHVEELDPKEFVPAPAQGVLGWQIRENDSELAKILANLNNKEVKNRISIERKVLNLFQGGCQLPLGVYCEKIENEYHVWTSISETWDSTPKRLHISSKNKEGLAEEIVARLKKKVNKSVFISKNFDENSLLYRAINNLKIDFEAQSLITTKEIPISKEIPTTDWIFFSSKNAVEFFKKQKPTIGKFIKIGVIGKGTAQKVKQLFGTPCFVGDSNNTKEIAEKFKLLVGTKTVLFPKSKNSLRTIQNALNENQVFDIDVYETVAKENIVISKKDILVFTSPSNVDAFLKNNSIFDETIIAIGKTTANYIFEKTGKQANVCWSSSQLGLIDTIQNEITK